MHLTLGDIVTMPLPECTDPAVCDIAPKAGQPASGPAYPGGVPGYYGDPGGGGDFGAAGGGGMPFPAGSGVPGDYGAGYGAEIPGGYNGAPGGGYAGGGPTFTEFPAIPGVRPRNIPGNGRGLPADGPGWVGPLAPQLILPDSALPPALARTNPLLRRAQWRANRWDGRLASMARLWEWIQMHGGLSSCCRIPELGAPVYNQPPWMVEPINSVQFTKMFAASPDAISGGPPYNGVDTVLGVFQVPIGWDGVINRVVFGYENGAGFTDFSGNIVWRVKVGVRFAKDLGNVKNTFGSFQNALLVPGNRHSRLISGQSVSLIANIPNLSPVAGGVVTAGVFGYYYPRR